MNDGQFLDDVSPHGITLLDRVVPLVLAMLTLAPVAGSSQVSRQTVGLNGTHLTIQEGVNACVSGVFCDVDVQGWATYEEHVYIPSSLVAGSITITGGWDSSFTVRDVNPDGTVIDGTSSGRVVDVRIGGGTFTMRGLTIAHGALESGAGIMVSPAGSSGAAVRLENLIVRNNNASSSVSARGGGVWAQLNGTERLEISRCNIHHNTATVTSGTEAAVGAGLMITALGTATFLVEHSWVEDNTAASDTSEKAGAGHFFSVLENASGEVVNLRVTGNVASGSEANVSGSGGQLYLTGNGQLVVRRSAWP